MSKPIELNISDVFKVGQHYLIPVYQRNYAWQEAQVSQLIKDIFDYSRRGDDNKEEDRTDKKNYYIGTLVIWERKEDNTLLFETIDGQQRLTTLNILFTVLKNEFDVELPDFTPNLKFANRPISSYSLEHIFSKRKEDDIFKADKDLNTKIIDAYQTIQKEVAKISDQGGLDDFVDYLMNKVIILRVPVPHDTDLNHYFEIMNNRGEQLEKHEVLKAQMLEVFKDEPIATKAFNTIWEACANMEKYVQYGFGTGVRKELFGDDWTQFKPRSLDDVIAAFNFVNTSNSQEYQIIELLTKPVSTDADQGEEKEESPERFNSIINFSNYLLHVLRIMVNQKPVDGEPDLFVGVEKDVPLDDKRLLDTFQDVLGPRMAKDPQAQERKRAIVERFGFLLLKSKFYYDQFIIKRNQKNEKWSLKYLKGVAGKPRYLNSLVGEEEGETGANRNALMLLSMFHVSAPTLIYKHWLNASLKYVLEVDEVRGDDYVNFLEDLSDAYLYNRFLATESTDDAYYSITYKENGKILNKNIDTEKLNKGTHVENFIFNRLDYLLWKEDQLREIKKYNKFYFSFRTSVEHYYPQNPFEGYDRLEPKVLDSFGNLCLISRSKNSKLSNYQPIQKIAHYKKQESIESIKQQIMMEQTAPDWFTTEIKEHGKNMRDILLMTCSDREK